MSNTDLKVKIRNALKNGFFSGADDLVDVSEGPADSIHVVVVSRKFDGRRLREKNELIWTELERDLLPEECEKVTLSVGASPEEIKAGG